MIPEHKEVFPYWNEDGSVMFSNVQLQGKRLLSYFELVDETCLDLEVLKNTYIHVVEGVCVWEEDFEYDEHADEWMPVEMGYEMIKKEAH